MKKIRKGPFLDSIGKELKRDLKGFIWNSIEKKGLTRNERRTITDWF